MQYEPYNSHFPITDWQAILGEEVEILSARSENETIRISCGYGDLCLRYDELRIELKNGAVIHPNQLLNACKTYWEKFNLSKGTS